MNDRTRAERRLPHHAVFAGQPVERPHSLPARVNRVSQQPAVLHVVFRDHHLDGYDSARYVRVRSTSLSDEVRTGSLRPRDPRHELHSMAEWRDGEWCMVQWEIVLNRTLGRRGQRRSGSFHIRKINYQIPLVVCSNLAVCRRWAFVYRVRTHSRPRPHTRAQRHTATCSVELVFTRTPMSASGSVHFSLSPWDH